MVRKFPVYYLTNSSKFNVGHYGYVQNYYVMGTENFDVNAKDITYKKKIGFRYEHKDRIIDTIILHDNETFKNKILPIVTEAIMLICLQPPRIDEKKRLLICKNYIFYKKVSAEELMYNFIEEFTFDANIDYELCKSLMCNSMSFFERDYISLQLSDILNVNKTFFDWTISELLDQKINFSLYPDLISEDTYRKYLRLYTNYTFTEKTRSISDIPEENIDDDIIRHLLTRDNGILAIPKKYLKENIILDALDEWFVNPKNFLLYLPKEYITDKIRIKILNKNANLISYIEDEDITEEIREYIVSLKDNNLTKSRHTLFYPIKKGTPITDDVPDIKTIVKGCIEGNVSMCKYLETELFDDLGRIKDRFTKWMKKFYLLNESCDYNLSSIGFCDETHRINAYWKSHLAQSSKQRVNISNSLNIEEYFNKGKFDDESRKMVIRRHYKAFNLLLKLGFDVVIYQQIGWRRGRDISVESIYSECNEDEDTQIFITNPNVADTEEQEPRQRESYEDLSDDLDSD